MYSKSNTYLWPESRTAPDRWKRALPSSLTDLLLLVPDLKELTIAEARGFTTTPSKPNCG